MKRLLSIFLLGSCLAVAADIKWVFYPEVIPASLPGASLEPTGVLVVMSTPGTASVCVAYTTVSDNAKRTACLSGTQAVRINLGASTADYSVDMIAVTMGDTTKSVTSPQPGVEY